MNSRHPNIQFICEEESNHKISFLDISVTRINNKLTASLYRKKTFSGVYLNFNSFLPMDHKKGLIHNLLFPAYNVRVDQVTLHNEIEFLISIWQRNSFPLFFIDNCIKKFLDNLFINRNISGTVSKKKEVFNCLEFLGKIYLQSKDQLTEIVCTCKKNIKLNVVFRSSNKIRNAFRFKCQIPKYMNLKEIYKLKCNICNDVYIGETKRHFLVREYEHHGKSILTEKNLKYTEKDFAAIKKHCHNHCHTANTFCFSLVGKADNKYHLKLKESLLFLKLKPSLNS